MKKTFTFILIFVSALFYQAQNSLLVAPVTGTPFASGKIDDMVLVSNGTDVALVGANNTTGRIYAFDINDNNPADSASNVITSVASFKANIQTALGVGAITLKNIEVNPKSKSIYVLAIQGGNSYIAIVKNNGSNITTLNLNTAPYCSMVFSAGSYNIQDLAWGTNTLFISTSNVALDGEIGSVAAPFIHNSTITKRATTMFKTNWGSQYFTDAPLEKMDFNIINGTSRLSGVTVCAPGFSIPTSTITGGGVLQVTEDFDMYTGTTLKVVAVKQNTTSYLFDLHDFNFSGNYVIYRIGEKYLDGSQVVINNHNNNADILRTSGNPAPGMTDNEIKKYPGYFTMLAFFSKCDLLVLTNTDVLQLLNIDSNCGVGTGISGNNLRLADYSLYPNPANDHLIISNNGNSLSEDSEIVVYTIEGKEILRTKCTPSSSQKIDISTLDKGTYFLSLLSNNQAVFNRKFLK